MDLRLFRDDPSRLTRVRWYFVDQDVPFIQRPYFFGPRNWDLRDWIDDDLGEVQARTWKNGFPPFPQVRGREPCGSTEQWANGVSVNDPVPNDWFDSTVPICCPHPPIAVFGGEAIGGADTAMPCGPCDFLPTVITAHLSSLGPGCSAIDGLSVVLKPDFTTCPATSSYVSLYRSDFVTVGALTGQFVLGCFCSSITPDYQLFFVSPDCAGTATSLVIFSFHDCTTLAISIHLAFFLTDFGCPSSICQLVLT